MKTSDKKTSTEVGEGWLLEACRRAVLCRVLLCASLDKGHMGRGHALLRLVVSPTVGLGCRAVTPETAAPGDSQRPERRTRRVQSWGHGTGCPEHNPEAPGKAEGLGCEGAHLLAGRPSVGVIGQVLRRQE